MTGRTRVLALVATAGLLWGGAALGADSNAMDCDTSKAPPLIAGMITKIDRAKSTVTLKERSGAIHEFQVAKVTMQDLKVGDELEASLRANPDCR